MDTLDVSGLSDERVRFLRELIAVWRERDQTSVDLPPLPDWAPGNPRTAHAPALYLQLTP